MTELKKIVRQLGSAILMVGLLGCAAQSPPVSSPATAGAPRTLEQQARAKHKAKKGAAVGAILGGIAGYVIGGRAEDAAIGAAAGAAIGGAIGYAIGKHQDKMLADRDTVVKEVHYTPDMGDFMKIEQVSINPQVVHPGGKFNLVSTYLVIPQDEKNLPKLEYFEGLKQVAQTDYASVFGPTVSESKKGGGRYTTTVPIELPKDMPTGDYEVGFSAKYGAQYQEQTAKMSIVSETAVVPARQGYQVAMAGTR
jgi:outer membrane lipoprotein SlyB